MDPFMTSRVELFSSEELRSGQAIAPERPLQNDISTSALFEVDPFIRHELIYLDPNSKVAYLQDGSLWLVTKSEYAW